MHQQAQMNGVFDFLKPKGGGPGGTGPGSSVVTPPKGSGVVNVLQAGASAIPVIGSSIASLLTLIGPLIKGHSEDWFADRSITDKDYNKFMGIVFKWYKERGLDPSRNNSANVFYKKGSPSVSTFVPEPFQSLRLIEWLPIVYENTKNPDLANIINEAIVLGRLDEKYFINSKGTMAPEPGGLTNLFGGGSDKPGGGSNYTIPLIIGGAALVAFLIFKKKK